MTSMVIPLGPTNGGITWDNGNTLLDPRLNTVTGYTITSALSSAVDTATNIPGVSSAFNGLGPDMGYKESAFTAVNLGPYYVATFGNDGNLGTFASPFKTIQKAAKCDDARSNISNLLYFPGNLYK